MSAWRQPGFWVVWGLGALLLAACVPPPAMNAGMFRPCGPEANRLWLQQERSWLLRQTALLETGPTRLTMNALLRLDMAQCSARLVAMDDFGVKLFDLTVTATGEDRHFLLPALARIPGIDGLIAASVRRIYLLPVTNGPGEAGMDHLIACDNGLLLERSRHLHHESWQVRYLNYREESGIQHPVHVVVDDRGAGWRLTVWTEEVKEDEEH
ncbi:MAG: hypothetical protein ACYC9I_01305 [Desulfuromonadales bacterium]